MKTPESEDREWRGIMHGYQRRRPPEIAVRNPQRARVHRSILTTPSATETEIRERRLDRVAIWLAAVSLLAFLVIAGVILGDVL